jgi:hypothetical protein
MDRSIKTPLAAYVEKEPSAWDENLPLVTFAYNTAVQASIQKYPFEVMFRRKPVIPTVASVIWTPKTINGKAWVRYLQTHIPIVHGQALESIKKAQEK